MSRLLFAAALTCGLAALAEEAPVSLTASDGTGLKLVSYAARAVVEDPLAFTELSLVFENPQDRVIEGQFKVTLPRGATVSRFAMKLDERWQEGEVVEKQAARRAYEDFLHRRQDPALLEQAAGNEFSARVFPIPARGRKELIVSWSHELPSSTAPFVLPLKGLPEVAMLTVDVSSGGKSVAHLDKARFVPNQDVAVLPARGGKGLRAGELLVTRVKAVTSSQPQPLSSLLLLLDTSASRALGYQAQLTLVQRLVAQLAQGNGALPLTVAAFDQSVTPIFDGKAADFGAPAIKALRDRRALGASDVSKALAWALEFGKKAPRARVLLVTDGVFTAGEVEGDQLLAAVARLKDAGVQRLDALGVGGIREDGTLKRLVTGKLPSAGCVLDGDEDVATLARRLGEATVAKVPLVAEGAKLVWPAQLEGVQAGDEAVVYVELGSASAPTPTLKAGGQAIDLSQGLSSIDRPLLERGWAQAKVQALLERQDRAADGPAQKQKLREQIVALSVKHRVLSPYTALLVLETEADYARFGIDRKALADIVTVKGGRISVLHRGPDAVPAPAAKKPAPTTDLAKSVPLERKKLKVMDSEGSRETVSGEGYQATTVELDTSPAASEVRLEQMPEREEAARPLRAEAARPEPAQTRAREEAERPGPRPAEAPAAAEPPAPPPPPMRSRDAMLLERRNVTRTPAEQLPPSKPPYQGKFKQVMDALAAKQLSAAMNAALGWREESPGDVLALVALGEACEATGDLERAARAYGSIIDLFPNRADLRRFAGGRLELLKGADALALAADDFAKAAEQRADHPASHRMLAFALLRQGKPERAFAAMEKALAQAYPSGRFLGVDRVLREDAGLIAAAWLKAEPQRAAEIRARLAKAGGAVEDQPSLRFVLTWETDANDVDFHILDGKGGHAWYSSKVLPSGGELYADVTTGYGPECFTIRNPPGARAYPYTLKAHYYSRGPMGYGMGKLELIEHDGKGGLRFEERPFVVMVDQAFVDLGQVAR